MIISKSLLLLLSALLWSPVAGTAIEEAQIEDVEPVVIGGEDPQSDKCCKYLAIIQNPGPHRDVEHRHRFVGNDKIGLQDKCAREHDPL